MSAKDAKEKDEKGKEKEKQKEVKRPKDARPAFKSIVRVAGKDLNGDLPVYRALSSLKGIGHMTGRLFAIAFENATNTSYDSKLSSLNEEQIGTLEGIIANPIGSNVPAWALNKRRDYSTGDDKHLIMAELDFDLRNTLKRLGEIRSYRGLRHAWGLPVRGQRTKSTHRGKGAVVGVLKKEVAQAAAAAKKEAKGDK